MKNLLVIALLLGFSFDIASQIDTISNNIYQNSGNMGIGTAYPYCDMEIVGDGTDDDIISIRNNDYARYAAYSFFDGKYEIPCFIGFRARGQMSSPLNIKKFDRITGLYGCMFVNGYYRVSSSVEMYAGNYISAGSTPSYIIFGTTPSNSIDRVERMRIDPQGNIGINTPNPRSKVEVADGDIFISDINRGIILKSPDGNCWRGTVDNGGSLHFQQISCPGDLTTQFTEMDMEDRDLTLYPNPSGNSISVDFSREDIDGLIFTVYNSAGQFTIGGNISSKPMEVDISDIPKGSYIFIIKDGQGNITGTAKFIKN